MKNKIELCNFNANTICKGNTKASFIANWILDPFSIQFSVNFVEYKTRTKTQIQLYKCKVNTICKGNKNISKLNANWVETIELLKVYSMQCFGKT